MPHLIHKFLYADELDRVERSGVDLCIACGLCSHVCPSKIDLVEEILEAREAIGRELDGVEDSEVSPQGCSTGEVRA